VFCFQLGIEAFRSINDRANVALLNCNLGHLMRIYASNQRKSGSQQPEKKLGQMKKKKDRSEHNAPSGMTPMEEVRLPFS